MSQVRVSESLLIDPRFKEMANRIKADIDILSGDEAEEMAVGKCWRAFMLAQKYWRDERKLIPESIWRLASNKSFSELLLAVGLAEIRPLGVYVCGAKEFFDWYHSKQEAGQKGGRISGENRRNKGESKQAKQSFEASEAEGRSNEPVMLCTVSDSVSVTDTDSVIEGADKPNGFLPRQLLDLWNANRGDLPKVERLTKARIDKIHSRREEEPELSYWEACIKRLASSDLATGKIKSEKYPNGWTADFDWLVKNDQNHVKVSEGKYESRRKSPLNDGVRIFTEKDFQ